MTKDEKAERAALEVMTRRTGKLTTALVQWIDEEINGSAFEMECMQVALAEVFARVTAMLCAEMGRAIAEDEKQAFTFISKVLRREHEWRLEEIRKNMQ